jgi:hypothetical protein
MMSISPSSSTNVIGTSTPPITIPPKKSSLSKITPFIIPIITEIAQNKRTTSCPKTIAYQVPPKENIQHGFNNSGSFTSQIKLNKGLVRSPFSHQLNTMLISTNNPTVNNEDFIALNDVVDDFPDQVGVLLEKDCLLEEDKNKSDKKNNIISTANIRFKVANGK